MGRAEVRRAAGRDDPEAEMGGWAWPPSLPLRRTPPRTPWRPSPSSHAEPTDLARIHVSLLRGMGVPLARFGTADGSLEGLAE